MLRGPTVSLTRPPTVATLAPSGDVVTEYPRREEGKTMDSAVEITSTSPEDLNAVLLLLAEAALPQEGVREHFGGFCPNPAYPGGAIVRAVAPYRWARPPPQRLAPAGAAP
jgi:hypothetical protein